MKIMVCFYFFYSYDALNRLVQINDSRGGLTNYTYDENSNFAYNYNAANQHINPAPTPDPIPMLLAETTADDLESEAFTVEEPTAVDPVTLGTFYYYQHDHLGSVSALTDSTGSFSTRYTYSAFGLMRSHTGGGQGNSYQYSTKAFDSAAGLYYYGSCYYDHNNRSLANTRPVRHG